VNTSRHRRVILLSAITLLFLSPQQSRAQEKEQSAAPKTVVIRFFVEVNDRTVGNLLNTIDAQVKAGTKRIIILISSPGGNVFFGLTAYNYLKAVPVEVITHNFGSVDSVATVMYCAGSKRYSVPDGQFLFHGLSFNFPPVQLDQGIIEEQIKMANNQAETIAKILTTCSNKKAEEVKALMNARTVVAAEDAIKWGLVNEIRAKAAPEGTQYDTISISADNVAQPPQVISNSYWLSSAPELFVTKPESINSTPELLF
jgi:ATP-dependent protease ClpP protease subunit